MFCEREKAMCLSEEAEYYDGRDQVLCFVSEKGTVSERGRGVIGW